ncbi:MAG: hypothetical protein R3C02_06000 [Planctomycetaceae bacterium]
MMISTGLPFLFFTVIASFTDLGRDRDVGNNSLAAQDIQPTYLMVSDPEFNVPVVPSVLPEGSNLTLAEHVEIV